MLIRKVLTIALIIMGSLTIVSGCASLKAAPSKGAGFVPVQQMAKSEGRANVAMADFVSPVGGPPDWVGGFAVTAGHGELEIAAKFKAAGDDYLDPIRLMDASDRLSTAKRSGDAAKIAAAQKALDEVRARVDSHAKGAAQAG